MKLLKFSGKLKKPRLFILRRVVGGSMLPTLRPGRIIIGITWHGTLHAGEIVTISQDGRDKIKRIARVQDGQLFVLGDNPGGSTDSRDFGWLEVASVQSKVIWPLNRHKASLWPYVQKGPGNEVLRAPAMRSSCDSGSVLFS